MKAIIKNSLALTILLLIPIYGYCQAFSSKTARTIVFKENKINTTFRVNNGYANSIHIEESSLTPIAWEGASPEEFETLQNIFKERNVGVEEVKKNFEKEMADKELYTRPQNWEAIYQDSIIYRNDNVISLRALMSSYTGGAHGMYGIIESTLSVSSLKFLEYRDVFQKGKKIELDILIKKYLRLYAQEKESDESMFFDFKAITHTDNFALTKEGIIFTYNPYEIACFAVGTVSITIPYEELEGLLVDGFREKFL